MHMEFLRPLYDDPGPWASVCTTAPPTDVFGAEVRELTVRGLCRALAEQGADPATVEAVRGALTGILPADAPHGTAVFATDGRIALECALPRALPSPLARWTALPHPLPLAESTAADVRCLVVRVDGSGADFELRDSLGGRPEEGTGVVPRPVHRTATADWSERHLRVETEDSWDHNAGEIAVSLADAAEQSRPDVVVLAGEPHEREDVLDRLPARLRDQLAVSDHGGRAAGTTSDLLDVDVVAASEEFRHRREREELDHFLAGGSDGTVVGVPELVGAAQHHRIDTLVLRPDSGDLKREVWVGPAADRMSVRRTADTPVSAQAGDALVRAAVAAGAQVAVIGPGRGGGPASHVRGGRGPGAATDAVGDQTAETAEGALPGGMGALLRHE